MITQLVDTLDEVVPYTANYFENIALRNNALVTDIFPQFNAAIGQINAELAVMNGYSTSTSTYAAAALLSANNAATSAATATSAANRAEAVVIPTTATYSYTQQDWRDSMMSKAEFNAIAAERRANRAGSGADNFGKGSSTATLNVNDGIYTSTTVPNTFYLGKVGGTGASATDAYSASINGSIILAKYLNTTTADATLLLPTAPTVLPSTAILTQQQIDSGVIKHADTSNSGLIVNGKFDTDTSGWTAYITDTAALAVAGEMKLTSTIGYARQSQGYATVIGKKYIIEFEAYRGTTSALLLYVGVGANGNANGSITLTNVSKQRFILEFIATSLVSYITVRVNETDTGTTGYFDNIAVFPADAISRQDFVFLRKKTVDLSVNDFYYPLGNTQFLGTTSDAGATVAGAFAGSATYSLFSDVWQADSALIGKGYVWSTLSDLNKKAVTVNPENNTYLDGDKVYQAQYGAKVEMMKGDTFTESTAFTPLGYTVDTIDKGLYKHSDGSEAIGICLVHRRNQGFKHPIYNPNGTKLASDSLPWYSTTVSFTSITDCFTDTKLLTTSGYIGTTSGRPDGLFYDQISEMDITDLRNNSAKVQDYNRLIDREFNRLVSDTYRGTEGEWANTITDTATNISNQLLWTPGLGLHIYSTSFSSLYSKAKVGDIVMLRDITDSTMSKWVVTTVPPTVTGYIRVNPIGADSTYAQSIVAWLKNTHTIECHLSTPSTRIKSNTLTHTDIIGSPANYPLVWKQSGVSGVPLIVGESGESLLPTGTTGSDGLAVYKLSRKANATPLQVLKSTDSGVTWTALTVTTHYTFSTTTNAITFTAGNIPLTTDLIRVTYQTHTVMTTPTVNSEVVASGRAIAMNGVANGHLGYSLIGKVMTASTSPYVQDGYGAWGYRIDPTTLKFSTTSTEAPTHTAFTLGGMALGVPAVKTGMYITRSNGKAYLNLVFKEIKHNGTSVGDDAKFNIVDNVSTTTDNNAQTVLIGQKRVELPYFIGAAE